MSKYDVMNVLGAVGIGLVQRAIFGKALIGFAFGLPVAIGWGMYCAIKEIEEKEAVNLMIRDAAIKAMSNINRITLH